MFINRDRINPGLILGVFSLLCAGCGHKPQVTGPNRELVASLATAVSARNTVWLESSARLIEQRRTDGQLTDAEYRTLSDIVAQVRAGNWKAAEVAVYALREAQEPTAKDLQRVSERRLSPEVGKARPSRDRGQSRPP